MGLFESIASILSPKCCCAKALQEVVRALGLNATNHIYGRDLAKTPKTLKSRKCQWQSSQAIILVKIPIKITKIMKNLDTHLRVLETLRPLWYNTSGSKHLPSPASARASACDGNAPAVTEIHPGPVSCKDLTAFQSVHNIYCIVLYITK